MSTNETYDFKSFDDYYLTLIGSQCEWPPYVKKHYYYEFGKDDYASTPFYQRLISLLEKCATQYAAVYRRGHIFFSWVVTDRYKYANICRSLGFSDEDFQVFEGD